jgi:hypothetical protein
VLLGGSTFTSRASLPLGHEVVEVHDRSLEGKVFPEQPTQLGFSASSSALTLVAVVCPCCLRPLTEADTLPEPVAPSRPGDFWCPTCSWFFAWEMVQPEGTMALDGIWNCPTHASLARG